MWKRELYCDNYSARCQPGDPHTLLARVILQVRGSRLLEKVLSLQDEEGGGGIKITIVSLLSLSLFGLSNSVCRIL